MKKHHILNIAKWIIYIGLSLIVVTIFTYMCNGLINTNDIDNTTIGTFGDFIGGFIGTLFSISTVLLVWLTYKTQNKQIKLQEIHLNKQDRFLTEQKFEDTFFKLLESHIAVKKSISFDTQERLSWWTEHLAEANAVISGDVFFKFAKEDFHRIYLSPNQLLPAITIRHDDIIAHLLGDEPEEAGMEDADRRIKLKYKKFLDVYHPSLGHYFRHLYYTLKYVDNNLKRDLENFQERKIQINERYKFYIGAVQSQMSSSELFLLFYNGWCFPKMKALIIKYNLLENLAEEDLIDTERHKNLYGENILKSRRNIINEN